MKLLLSLLFLFIVSDASYADKYDDLVYGSINYQYKSENIDNISDVINNKQYRSVDNKKITIMFSNGSVSGSSGVNRYIGSYSVKDSIILITGFGSTMMMGPKEMMEQEQEYLKFLKGRHNISISQDKLFIGNKEFDLIKSEKQN